MELGEQGLTSPRMVREILARYGLRPNRHLGQNFLVDENIMQKIVAAAEIMPADTVVEIGPGIGTLTRALARQARQVLAVEIDRGLIPVLKETLAAFTNVKIILGDILKVDLGKHLEAERPLKVVANLPYYITTPVIMGLLEGPLPLERLVVMVQREVAARLVAEPGTKDYGVLSLAVRFYTEPVIVHIVPRTVFLPRPEVDSAVIRLLVRREPAVAVPDPRLLFRLIRAAFAQRRKTLINSLGAQMQEYSRRDLVNFLTRAGIEPERRGETLSLEEFAALTRIIAMYGMETGKQGSP